MAIVQSDGALSVYSQSLVASRMNGGYSGLTWYNGLTEDYAAIYRTQPNVRMVVNFLARNIAQLGLKPFERISDTERLSLGDHDLGRLIRVPNPIIKMTRYRFILAMISDLGIFDNFFALKVRNEATGKLRLWRLPPDLMQPIEGSLWEATSWRFLGIRSQPVFSSDDLIHMRGYNPEDSRVGLSPIESIRQTLSEDKAAGEYREQFWRGGARISGVIERPATGAGTPRWSEEAKRRFLAEWRGNFEGNAAGAGGTPLLEDGMQFKQVAFSAKDSEYLGARRLSREEVAAIYHVSPLFVGILENANFSNVKEQHRHLYQDTLGPTLTMVQEDLQLQLISEFPDLDPDRVYLEFDLAEKLKGSFEERAALPQTAVGGPWMTRNEARAEENKPPIEGGDEMITPLNVLIGGQASPRDSAPDGTNARVVELPKARAALAKAAEDDLPDEVVDWFEQHVQVLSTHFGRQENSVVAALGAGNSIESIFAQARWNRELKADLLELAEAMTVELGTAVADEFNGGFDPGADGVGEYLDENARIAAENVNFATQRELEDLDPDDADFLDNVRNVFAVAAGSRAAQVAVSRVTGVGNFARREGAKQGGAQYKVWNVRSLSSRHPRMDGQKVGIDEEFSNGARWPGDASLSDDERAGCVCSMSFE